MFSGSAIPNTNNGILLSLHIAVAVESITFKSLFNTSKYDISSNLIASFWIFGSAEYTASIAFPNNMMSAFISVALNTAAVSVVKYGCPVPHANITTLPLFKCFYAFLCINCSAISLISIAVCTLEYIPLAYNASCNASAFIPVANIPM